MYVPTVLFVCVHNGGRSQMAAGFLQHLAGDGIHVLSAGSQPADQVNQVVMTAMAEEGIDITTEVPKILDDPAGHGIDVVRPIRDEIRRRVEVLVRELAP